MARRVGISLAAFAAIALLGSLCLHLYSTVQGLREAPRSSIQAAAYRAERSFDRLLEELATGNGAAGFPEARFRLEFAEFSQTLGAFESGSFSDAARELAKTSQVLQLKSDAESTLSAHATLDGAAIDQLRGLFEAFEPNVDRFVSEASTLVARLTDQRRADLAFTIALAGVVVAALLSALAFGLVLLLRQRQGLRHYGDQLRQTVHHLAEAQRIANVGTFEWDYVADRVSWSSELAAIYGIPEGGSMAGREFRRLLHPDDVAMVEAAEAAALRRSALSGRAETRDVQYRVRRPDGTEVNIHGVAEILADPMGRPVTMTATVRDVTEQYRQRRALEQGERILADAQRIAHLGSFKLDLQTGKSYWSDELLRICDFPGDPFAPQPRTEELVHPDDLPGVLAKLEEARRSPVPGGTKVVSLEHRLRWRDGTIRFIRGTAEMAFAADGEQLSLAGTLQDITEAHEQDMALRAAKAEAEQANAAKSEFLAVMSHELRTPMNGVLGMLNALADTDLATEQQSFVSVARNSAEALLSILNDILDMSKIEAGKLELELTRFELHPLLRSVVHLYAQQARSKGISLDTDLDPRLAKWFEGDAGRLRQMTINLVSNAIKFTQKGGVLIRARVEEELADGVVSLRIEVVDTGPGIPLEKQGEVFGKFNQLDRSYARRFGGTGLGLSICKRLAELMGGTIGFDSTPGQGTTFWVAVPMRPGIGQPSANPVEARKLPPMRVLVAEDNATNQLVARMILEKMGHRVEFVENGLEAIDAVQHRPFDLVMMDVSMPLMDGLEATRRIRALSGKFETLPIVAMTANAMDADVEACLAAGMSAFVGKPIIRDKLQSALEVLTAGRSVIPDTASEIGEADQEDHSRFDASSLARLEAEVGREAMPELLWAYVADLERCEAVLSAPHAESIKILRAAHSVKGISLNLGNRVLAERADAVEAKLRADPQSPIEDAVQRLVRQTLQTKDQIIELISR